MDRERAMDRLFASGTADDKALAALVDEIGELTARLRYTHLRAHLEMRELLTAEQIARYEQIRGYRAGEPGSPVRVHGSDHQGHAG